MPEPMIDPNSVMMPGVPTPPKATPAPQHQSAVLSLLQGGKDNAAEGLFDEPQPGKTAEAAPSAPPVQGEVATVKIPETKAEASKMTVPEMEAVLKQGNIMVPNWETLTAANKKKAFSAALFPDKASPAAKLLLNDPMTQIAHEIETLDDPAVIEQALRDVMRTEGMNDFKMGGLLQKLQDKLVLPEGQKFGQYVEATYGIAYRKCRYLIQIYNTVILCEIGWGDVEQVGWTKMAIMAPILTKENAKEWLDKAKQVNCPTLQQMVKDYQKAMEGGGTAEPTEEKNYVTKSFNLFHSQVEVVEAALLDSMKKSGTENRGFGLENICQEYLGSTENKVTMAAYTDVLKERDAAMARVNELVAKLEAAVGEGPVSLKGIYGKVLAEAGAIQPALEQLFGGEFEEVFPGLDIHFDVKQPAGGSSTTAGKKAAKASG